MKIAGLAMNDVWAHRVLRESGVSTLRVEDVPSEITVHVDQVDVLHHGAKRSFRPYLHLTGELRGVRPEEQLPYGVNEVTYPQGGGERVEAFYEFTNGQLTELVAKGYFSEGFRAPDEITGIEWELPARVDAVVLAPTAEEPAPVVFTGVRDIASLSIDEASTEYDLAEYFADYSRDDVVRHQEQVTERSFRTRTGEMESLFDADEFDELKDVEATGASTPGREEAGASGITQALADVEAGIDADAQAYATQREAIAGTPEHLYRERVASAWDEENRSESTDDIEAPAVDATGALDLDEDEDEEELGVEPIRLTQVVNEGSKDVEASKRALARKVADFEVSDEGKGLGE